MERLVLFGAVLIALLVLDFGQTLLAFPLFSPKSATPTPDQTSGVNAGDSD